VALDRAGEALALRGAGDLDGLALLEDRVGRQLGPDLELARLAPELGEVLQHADAGLLQVAQLRLGQLLLARLAEGELDGVVAVALRPADRRHEARAGLDHGHALDVPVLGVEDLRHTDFSSE
jgi:hypothetical protein